MAQAFSGQEYAVPTVNLGARMKNLKDQEGAVSCYGLAEERAGD